MSCFGFLVIDLVKHLWKFTNVVLLCEILYMKTITSLAIRCTSCIWSKRFFSLGDPFIFNNLCYRLFKITKNLIVGYWLNIIYKQISSCNHLLFTRLKHDKVTIYTEHSSRFFFFKDPLINLTDMWGKYGNITIDIQYN